MRSITLAFLAFALALATFAAEAASAAPVGWIAPLSDGTALELAGAGDLDVTLPSPERFLGYPLGTRFTHYDRIVDYLEALAETSDRVALASYGTTYEGRPLTWVAVSSAANIRRLEDLRRRHRLLADPSELSRQERQELLEEAPLVVWLGYGVHGNESSSAEAAMGVAYLLAADRHLNELLESTVVLIDPLANPDGRERYVSAYEQRLGHQPDPDPEAAEHQEPWPGGRQNHYLIDLNRDWAWATQQETRDRLAVYQQWEPQVAVDLHEMSNRSTYFFPPAAEPVHPLIDPQVLRWLDVFGQANAAAFDRYGWIYYKAENYDLFYPGYGDSYPFLRGAVGMTYEMAGGGRAGLAIRLPDGRTLTLADRIARHLTASLTTVATATAHRRELLADFVAARLASERQEAASYVWAADQQEAHALASLLALHGIRVHRLKGDSELAVAPIGDEERGSHRRRRFASGDFAVSTRQPLGALTRALMERETALPETFLERQRQRVEQSLDAEFYDITAWNLPLAYHLEVWQMEGEPQALEAFLAGSGKIGGLEGSGEVGYLIPPRGLAGYQIAAELQRRQILFRLALAPIESGGERFPPGTLFVPRRGNPEDLEVILDAAGWESGVRVRRISSAYGGEGISLGSDRVAPVRAPRVGLIGGEGIHPTSLGSLWHLLDREIALPYTRLDLDRLGRTDLSDFDTLIFPDGSGYSQALGDEESAAIDRWLKAGGTLVAVGDAVEWLQEREMTSIESWQPADAEEGGEGRAPEVLDRLPVYTPGAIVATAMESSHPLTAGLPGPPPVLVRGTRILLPTGKPQQDLLTVAQTQPVISGFAWPEAAERLAGSLLMGVERRSAGTVVVFAQDPAFRVFWRATIPLFLNAVMYGPSVAGEGRY